MGRPSKTSVQATSKERKLFKEKKMAQKRKGLTLDLNAAAGVGPSGLGIFSKKSKLALKNLLQHQIPEQTITGSHVGLPSVIKNEPNTRTSIETIEKATAAHRAAASKLVVPNSKEHLALSSVPEFSPRPESSASGSMDSAELRIKEEMDDSNDDFDEDDSFSEEESVKTPAPKGRGGGRSKKITPINMESQEKIKLERKRLRNRLAASK